MKLIGLIGGMSWESSLEYYRLLNEEVKARLGGLHSARCLLYSVDFAEIEAYQVRAEWAVAGMVLADAASALQRAGAECLLLCTNTMHKVAPEIQSAVHIPLLHIADATAAEVIRQRIRRVGLLGTAFTMQESFYKDRLIEKFGLEVLIPEASERILVHQVIYEELVLGTINPQSRHLYQQIIHNLVQQGAQGIILGCTEIGLLVKQSDSPVPLFDTTSLHAGYAVDFALAP